MKKNIEIILILFFNSVFIIIYGQDKEIVIIDSHTEKPVNLVQIYYPLLQTGGISNEDGKAIIPIKNEVLITSHINYNERKIDFEELERLDTLRLHPKQNVLNEVVIYNYDLKNKISEVLKEYTKHYSSKKIINHATYKETHEVNDSLVRLFQIQLDWWSKNYIYDFNSKVEKFNRLKVKNVDYSKIGLDTSYTAGGAGMDNSDFFKFCHLNFLLYIIRYKTKDIRINSVTKNGDFVQVNFDGKMIEDEKTIYNFKNSSITFKGNTIHNIRLNMKYTGEVNHKSVSIKYKIPYTSKVYLHKVELSFKKNFSDKLFLGLFKSEITGETEIYKNTSKITTSQKLLINKTEFGKRLKISDFDFKKHFHENLKEKNKSNNLKFRLTKKEIAFINE